MLTAEKGGVMKTAGMIGAAVLATVLFCGCDQSSVAADESGFWKSDYDTALKQASAENKYVLVNISGQAWCGWCQALESEVFSKPEFIDYAKANLVCVLLDFNSSGGATNAEFAKQHETLLKKFQIQGFPTVLILNPQGKEIVRDGYQRGGPVNYVTFIKGVIAADTAK
jgi:protein disulfide-isomerase